MRIDTTVISFEQQRFINQITANLSANITAAQATVAIYLYFNRLVKPENELEAILSPVATVLRDRETIGECLSWMKRQGLVQSKPDKRGNLIYIEIADDFEDKLEQITGVLGLAKNLQAEYNRIKDDIHVESKGKVGADSRNYTEMLMRIKAAKRTVKYAVLTTEPYDATVNALMQAADGGVKVQILVASDRISKEYKNKRSVASQWQAKFYQHENVSIKIFDDESTLDLCSSVLIDEKILRLDIYDPRRVRSLSGQLIEICSETYENINLIRWFSGKFDAAWKNAYANRLEKFYNGVVFPIIRLMALYFYSVLILCYKK